MTSRGAVDVTVYHRGFHGDLNETYLVGEVSREARELVTVTWECLRKAMDMGECPQCQSDGELVVCRPRDVDQSDR